MPTKILKETSFIYKHYFTDCVNSTIDECKFPNKLKKADIRPCSKNKGEKLKKSNYRPLSVLPALSKVLERILGKQLDSFMQTKFSPYLCGFRKGYSTQHAILKLLENWRAHLDKGENVGTILCDLSKAFDTLPHDLLIAKLNAYGVGQNALHLINDYLSEREQRCKVGSKYSTWRTIIKGVPQGSVLGPLLFNIFINDLFLFINDCELCNFADDQTLYTYHKVIDVVVNKLEKDLTNAINWFDTNGLVANPNKFQVMFLGTRSKSKLCLNINGMQTAAMHSVKLLGLNIDWKLTFTNHVMSLSNKANGKARALSRLRFKLNIEQKTLLYNSFISSYFGYCPITWMFCGKSANLKAEQVKKRALRAIYNDYSSSYTDLLEMGDHQSIHRRNLNYLLYEVYKSIHGMVPEFMSNIFTRKLVYYELRISNLLVLPKYKTYGLKSFGYRGALCWNNLHDELKQCINIDTFKMAIGSLKSIYCTCDICSK